MAGHFYPTSGIEVISQVLQKDGISMRDADARDAKKNNWGVGVTTVLSIPQKYHLQNWIIDQHLKAVLSKGKYLPMHWEEGDEFVLDSKETVNDWRELIKKEAKIEQEKTSKKGKQIHKMMENIFELEVNKDEYYEIRNSDLFLRFCEPVLKTINEKFKGSLLTFKAEQTFYHQAGFGGTVDLYSRELSIILDFKTKDKGKDDWNKVQLYDEHYMQLEAYRLGLQMPETTRMFIVFISQVTPGLHEIRELTKGKNGDFCRKKLQRAGKMFEKLLHYWQHAHDMSVKDVRLYPSHPNEVMPFRS